MLQKLTVQMLAVHGGYVLKDTIFGTLLLIPSIVKKHK